MKMHIIAFKALTCVPKDLPLAINLLIPENQPDV